MQRMYKIECADLFFYRVNAKRIGPGCIQIANDRANDASKFLHDSLPSFGCAVAGSICLFNKH